MSFSTTRDRFADDAETCTRMCPGRTVSLYYHSVADEEAAELVSIDGNPYSELSNAFRYRNSFDSSCTCGRPDANEGRTQRGPQSAAETLAQAAPLPRPRPEPAQDPETIANRMGGFIDTEIEPGAFASTDGRFGRSVRRVGPAYLELATELLVRPVRE